MEVKSRAERICSDCSIFSSVLQYPGKTISEKTEEMR